VHLDYPEVGGWQSVCPWVAVCFRNLLAWKVRPGEIGEIFVFAEIDHRKSLPGHQWSLAVAVDLRILLISPPGRLELAVIFLRREI
jgi:hypothetical protein